MSRDSHDDPEGEQKQLPTVLLVDERVAESPVSRALSASGHYKVVAVPHHSDVQLRVRERKPESLIIVAPPDLSRVALTSCALIRRTRVPVRPNILFWAADGNALTARCAWAVGADDVVIGPIRPEGLVERLTALAASNTRGETEDQRLSGSSMSGTWLWDLESDEVTHVSGNDPPESGADPRVREFLRASFGRAMSNRGSYSAYYRDIQHDGNVRLLRQHGSIGFSETGTPRSLQCSIFDETHRRRAVKRLSDFDYVEHVPDLGGTVLYDALEYDIRARRDIVGLLFLNIDPLRDVHDVLDESTTEELLAGISMKIASLTRDEDLLANYPSLKTKLAAHGAAKYVLLLRDLKSVDDFENVARRIQAGLRASLRAGDREFTTYATVGAASFPQDGGDARTVMQAAEIALRKGRQEGGDRVVFFRESMRSGRVQKLETALLLRQDLRTEKLRLHFQPIFDISLQRVVSLEALVRWDDRNNEPVAPDLFIPIAEESNLIVELGEWALRAACAQLRQWHDAGFAGIRLAVNVASRQLHNAEFVPLITRMLEHYSLPPSNLELELTERSIAENIETVISAFRACKKLGVRVVIDDFGTGHSALNYLKNFPVDVIKIDKSYVHGLATNNCDSAITATMIDLAHRLDLSVVAEGVERAEQLSLLQNLGCDAVQGYLFARPMEAADVCRWLEAFVGVGGSAHWNPLYDSPEPEAELPS